MKEPVKETARKLIGDKMLEGHDKRTCISAALSHAFDNIATAMRANNRSDERYWLGVKNEIVKVM